MKELKEKEREGGRESEKREEFVLLKIVSERLTVWVYRSFDR